MSPTPLPAVPWIERGANARWLVLAIWLETVLMALFMARASIPTLAFHDPDDAMRLVQVRDWLNGQGWFDVTQHRSNPPFGAPMHWSRLVDVPIAFFILLFRPLVGVAQAEVIACIAVPALTLLSLFFALFHAVRTLMGTGRALLSCALLATSPFILAQTAPLRIDHHGWQLVMLALALGGMLAERPRMGGLLAGMATALWLHISSEGLPFAVMIGGILALRYVWDAAQWQRFFGFVGSLFVGLLALQALVRGWPLGFAPVCDAISSVYLLPLGAVALAVPLARKLVGGSDVTRRLVGVALAGLIGGTIFLAFAGPCLKGPFQALDPIIYRYWYVNVLEGQPVWRQPVITRGIMLLPLLVGLIGTICALAMEKDAERRRKWAMLLALALGGSAVGIMVSRAVCSANLLALPGNAWLISRLYVCISQSPHSIVRVLGSVGLTGLSPIAIATMMLMLADTQSRAEQRKEAKSAFDPVAIGRLGDLPPAAILTEIDNGPTVLLHTHHKVIATGHHRNARGMKLVFSLFLAAPDKALPIFASSGATYLLFDPDTGESKTYARINPHGLGAMLLKGRAPGWLQPVAVPGMNRMRLYRTVPAIPAS